MVLETLLTKDIVALGSEPTQILNIIKEKMQNPILDSGSVGMTGRVEVSKVNLSHSKEDLTSGKVKIVYGYQESWSNETGMEIIKENAAKEQIGFLFFDEAHQNLLKFWGGWRQEMMMGPSEMRLLAKRPPILLMSATLTREDCSNLSKCVGIRSFVTITRSPILDNIKFVTIQRPTNQKGSGIVEGDVGEVKVEEGRMLPIMKAFLDKLL